MLYSLIQRILRREKCDVLKNFDEKIYTLLIFRTFFILLCNFFKHIFTNNVLFLLRENYNFINLINNFIKNSFIYKIRRLFIHLIV